jgi:hypothetical protein
VVTEKSSSRGFYSNACQHNTSASVKKARHAKVLQLAFSIGDPNHMPVTRDLSEGKRLMILQYLDAVIAKEKATAPGAMPAPTAPRALAEKPREPIDHLGGKTTAARQFARASGRPDVT